ncbi:hypothetical protein [Nocardioides zhouii]|uniref:Uncharacterized protein n=1 Tax=Nocardioides zhouii TaxID=1168729 RepID=A0A4Q2T1G9_9ACTN|nr:hypothetical protein [Nocardioides zhouii]RYC10548.1 hypothetical protein EUA94_12175 [Nocardioides zhouii]
MTVDPGAGELNVMYGAGLERAFPELFFDWFLEGDALYIGIQSWCGTSSRLRVGLPLDLGRVYDAARQHIEEDAARELVADRLVVAVVGGYDRPDAAHIPYILRWLAVAQQADVSFGDHPDVSPVLRSPSVALVHTPSQRLKVWADGTGVLHYDDPLSPTESPRESTGLDLSRLMLRDFQTTWLPVDRRSVEAEVATALKDLAASSPEVAALRLLGAHDGGMWLQHHRFVDAVLPPKGASRMDWTWANRLSTMDTEATVQDRAVLAVACHLSGHVTPLIPVAEALHNVGAARSIVLHAIDGLTGGHPDPHTSWAPSCPSCP